MKNIIVNFQPTMTKALIGTTKVKVEVLKQKENAVKREKKLMMMAPVIEKLRNIEKDMQKPSVKNDLEKGAENIRPMSNIVMRITEKVEVVVDPLMWK